TILFISIIFTFYNYIFFSFYSSGYHRDLHSFPTRRSSDLSEMIIWGGADNRITSRGYRYSPASDTWTPMNAPGVHRGPRVRGGRSEEHTSELQSRGHLVCRLLLEKKKKKKKGKTKHSNVKY